MNADPRVNYYVIRRGIRPLLTPLQVGCSKRHCLWCDSLAITLNQKAVASASSSDVNGCLSAIFVHGNFKTMAHLTPSSQRRRGHRALFGTDDGNEEIKIHTRWLSHQRRICGFQRPSCTWKLIFMALDVVAGYYRWLCWSRCVKVMQTTGKFCCSALDPSFHTQM